MRHHLHLATLLFTQRAVATLRLASVIAVVACFSTNKEGYARPVAIAAAGYPFGVAQITLPIDPHVESLPIETNGYLIQEASGRVYYPTVANRRVVELLRELMGSEVEDRTVSVFFRFQGTAPLDVTVYTPEAQRIRIVPRQNRLLYRQLQRSWWRQYASVARLRIKHGEYPPLIETYLTTMLRERLGLTMPAADRRRERREQRSIHEESLLLILNSEKLRMQALRRTLNDEAEFQPATLPLPPAITWKMRPAPPAAADVEPIAAHVPEECFYVRFGSFDNYLWFKKLLEQQGGNLSRIISLRGHDTGTGKRTQQQLGLKESKIAEYVGRQLITDIALIGFDTYLAEGGAMGVVFESASPFLVGELKKQLAAAARQRQSDGATIEEITIDGQPVIFASSPDNRLRSFFVSVGDYHLITNCRALASRYLGVGQGERPLSASGDFLQARQQYPLDESAVVFAFLPPKFFENLMSPQYQIELRRRLKAVTDIELVHMARQVAISEGHVLETVPELVSAGYLPPFFARRADGSHVVIQDQVVFDSLRGKRGSFLPIPDVPVNAATPGESRHFNKLARFHQTQWTEMDPLVAQIRRQPVSDSHRERIEIRAEMFPFHPEKYGRYTSILGAPTTQTVLQPEEDIVRIQAVVNAPGPQVGTHHLVLGMQDRQVDVAFSDSRIPRMLQVLRTAPAYVGSWPAVGLLEVLPSRPLPQSGSSQLPFGLWRHETPEGFALAGVDRDLLTQVAPSLSLAEQETAAQIRVHIGDVSQAKIKTWFAALNFQRAYATSVGNTRLLHRMNQQLGVDFAQARDVAERILGVKLVCGLDGDYQLYEPESGPTYWGSSHWPKHQATPEHPSQFAAPLLSWFRGLDAECTMEPDRITVSATLEMESPKKAKPAIPFFDLFSGSANDIRP